MSAKEASLPHTRSCTFTTVRSKKITPPTRINIRHRNHESRPYKLRIPPQYNPYPLNPPLDPIPHSPSPPLPTATLRPPPRPLPLPPFAALLFLSAFHDFHHPFISASLHPMIPPHPRIRQATHIRSRRRLCIQRIRALIPPIRNNRINARGAIHFAREAV